MLSLFPIAFGYVLLPFMMQSMFCNVIYDANAIFDKKKYKIQNKNVFKFGTHFSFRWN